MFVTSLFTSILGIMYFRISMLVIGQRRKNKVLLGSGENSEILSFTSAHDNFKAYVPILLLLLYFLESHQVLHWGILISLGFIITIGRYFHFKGVTSKDQDLKLRVRGMKMTLFPLMIMSILNILILIYKSLQ